MDKRSDASATLVARYARSSLLPFRSIVSPLAGPRPVPQCPLPSTSPCAEELWWADREHPRLCQPLPNARRYHTLGPRPVGYLFEEGRMVIARVLGQPVRIGAVLRAQLLNSYVESWAVEGVCERSNWVERKMRNFQRSRAALRPGHPVFGCMVRIHSTCPGLSWAGQGRSKLRDTQFSTCFGGVNTDFRRYLKPLGPLQPETLLVRSRRSPCPPARRGRVSRHAIL